MPTTLQFAKPAIKDLKRNDIAIGTPYTFRFELDTWTNSTIAITLQSPLFATGSKVVSIVVPAKPKKKLLSSAPKPIFEVAVTFDKWVDGDQNVTIGPGAAIYTVGTRASVTVKALGAAVSFDTVWIVDTASATVDTDKPLKPATEYDVQLKVVPTLKQELKAKVKSACFQQAEYEATFPANAATAKVRVRTKDDAIDWTDVVVDAGVGTRVGDKIEEPVQVGWKVEFPPKPFLAGKKGKAIALDEVEIGKEYTIQFQLANWAHFDACKIKLSSPLFTASPKEFDVTPLPADPAKKGKVSSKTFYVTAKVTFDKWVAGPQKVKIEAGDYKIGSTTELTVTAIGPAVEFDTPWLTSSAGDADPENKALELYQTYLVHLKLGAPSTQAVKVSVISDAFTVSPILVTIPPKAAKITVEVQTKEIRDDWTEVKLEAGENCSLGARASLRCWVEAPVVSFADSPLSTALAAVQDLLKLWPGKHMLHFQLSYAPHKPPPGVVPKFTLKSATFAGDIDIPLPVGVTSFSHEVELRKNTPKATPISFLPAVVGCVAATTELGRVRKTRVPGFVLVAIGDTRILFNGLDVAPPYEDGQRVKIKFRLDGVAGVDGAKATLESNAFTAKLDIVFPAFSPTGAEVKVEAELVKVVDILALDPKPKRTVTGFLHEFKMVAGDGCGEVEVSTNFRGGGGDFGPAKEAVWKINVARPRIVLDPQATKQGPYKPGDKFRVRVVLPDGPPRHADIVADIACPSIVGLTKPVTFTVAAGESEQFIELEVADVKDPKGIDHSQFEDFNFGGDKGNKKQFDLVYFDKATIRNCVNSGGDREHEVPGLPIRIEWLAVTFHREHPYRPENGIFNEEKIWFTITHSYPAPAGASINLVSTEKNGLKAFADVIAKPLDTGKLMTIVEVTANTGLRPGSKYQVEIQPESLCIKGKKDVKTVEVHIPATLMFGGKRKHRIEPEGPYEPGQQVTLTVHLEYHPKGRANTVAEAPAGGCTFAIECDAFDEVITGKIPAGRSETVVTAEIGAHPGTHVAKLKLADAMPATATYMALKGCRVDSEVKDNSFDIEVGAITRRRVFFDDTVSAVAGADQTVGATSVLTVKLDGPAPKLKDAKKTVARVSSKAFAEFYLVEFATGQISKPVTVTWTNSSPDRQLVRVDGVKMCEAEDKTASTRADPGLGGVTKRQHMFTVNIPPVPVSGSVAPCPQVARAIAKDTLLPCAIELFAIVERHGEAVNVIPERGAKKDGVFPVPATPLVQMIAGRKSDTRAEALPEFHRTEVLFRFPGKNVVKPENHKPEEIHPAVYMYRIDRKGNRLSMLPVNPLSEVPNRTLNVTPGFWDIRFPVVAGSDVRGLQLHQATLPMFETKNSKNGFFPGVWNKIKRNIPTVDFWNMLRQQKPRINRYEIEMRDCSAPPRKVQLEVYPSDEYCLKISVKPFAPFSWGVEGSCVDSMGQVKPKDDMSKKPWESQYGDPTDLTKSELKFRDASPIGGIGTGSSVLNTSSISSKQGRGRIPKLTVEALNDLAGELEPEHEFIFQIAESFGTGAPATTLTKGGVAVLPNDYVLWDGEADEFVKTPKPGALLWKVDDLNELVPDHREIYKVLSPGVIYPGLVPGEGTLKPAKFEVTAGAFVAFDSKVRRWTLTESLKSSVPVLNARDWVDGSVRKLTTAGKLKQGAVNVVIDDYVIWRASRKSWELLDKTTVEDLRAPVDQALYLEMAGTKVGGARVWNAATTKWDDLTRKTVEQLAERVLEEDGIYAITGRGTVGGLAVEDNDALLWSGGVWTKLIKRGVEALNPQAKDGEIYRTTEAIRLARTNFVAGDCLKYQAGTFEKIPAKLVATLNGLVTPADGLTRQMEDAGVLEVGQIAVAIGDLVRFTGGAWKVLPVPRHEGAWFSPAAFAMNECVVMTNAGTIEAGAVDVSAGDVVQYDGLDWTLIDPKGRHPVSFYNQELVKDGDMYVVANGGTLGTLAVAAGDIVKFVAPNTWTKVPTDDKRKWQPGWFDWSPVEHESYVVTNTGDIDGSAFGAANMVAIRRGAGWVPSAEETLEVAVEDLNKPLVNGDIYSLTDAGTLKSGAVVVAIGDVVVWDSAVPEWVKTDTSTAVEWDPEDFNDREELLLNTFAVRDAGTLEKGALAVTADQFVRYDHKEAKWILAEVPQNSRSVRSIGHFDDSQWQARISGEDGRLPLSSTKPFQSSYCFYPGDAPGGLPESWGQQFSAAVKPTGTEEQQQAELERRRDTGETPLQADEVQKQLDQTSVYAGFIPSFIGDRISISMTRNGREDNLCAEMRRMAYTIAFIAQNIMSLVSSTENAVPTMGYSVSAVINIFEGDLMVRWGWKEFVDHQVFYWEQVHASLMVFRIGARVDLGFRYNVMVVRFEAIIYFKITLELKWEKAWERRGPGEAMTGDSAWTSVIGKIELGASIVLLHENWCSASAAASSGIEAKFRWISRNAGGMEYQIYFLGIILNVKGKLLGFKELAFSKPLKKGSPPGIPWKRGMLPGAANPSYFDIRATFGLSMSKIIWDRNHLADVLESMVELQQQVLKARTHDSAACLVCPGKGVVPKGRGWPVAPRPNEPGWDEQWGAWVKSVEAEAATLPVRKLMRYAVNAVVKTNLMTKLTTMEGERKALLMRVLDRLDTAERKLDEIAALEKRVDEAEEAGDERAETLDELMALAEETEDWMLEVRGDDPNKAPGDRHSIGKMVKDIRWWCMRMEHYTSFQKHWGTV